MAALQEVPDYLVQAAPAPAASAVDFPSMLPDPTIVNPFLDPAAPSYAQQVAAATKETHRITKAVWRTVQRAMCAALWSMIPAAYLQRYESLNRQFLALLLATRDWITDLQARRGIVRVPPYDLAYVATAVHPLSRRSSVDGDIGRRNERIAMNGVAYQMMGWGSSWVQKAGGDVQHQVLQVALHYIYLMQQPTVPREADGTVSEYV